MARFRKNIKSFLLCVRAPDAMPQKAPGQSCLRQIRRGGQGGRFLKPLGRGHYLGVQ